MPLLRTKYVRRIATLYIAPSLRWWFKLARLGIFVPLTSRDSYVLSLNFVAFSYPQCYFLCIPHGHLRARVAPGVS